jgi:hypothetical protein
MSFQPGTGLFPLDDASTPKPSEFFVAVHTIGEIRVDNTQNPAGTVITLSFGKSGKVVHSVKQNISEVLGRIQQAQQDDYQTREELCKQLLAVQRELIAAKDEIISLLRGGYNQPN